MCSWPKPPIGMALIGSNFYVADTDALLRFPYHTGDTEIRVQPVQVAGTLRRMA
jgi:glucose/arabinose dehydrogenase